MAEKEYELKVSMSPTPGVLLGAGDKVKLTEERAAELIDAGAIVDPKAKTDDEDAGAQTAAPKAPAKKAAASDSGPAAS